MKFANDWIRTTDFWCLKVTAIPTELQPLPLKRSFKSCENFAELVRFVPDLGRGGLVVHPI